MKFNEKMKEVMKESVMKVELMHPVGFKRADGLVSTKAIVDINAGISQIFNDLLDDGYEKDEVEMYIYALVRNIIKQK